jgi:hypothetical protein
MDAVTRGSLGLLCLLTACLPRLPVEDGLVTAPRVVAVRSEPAEAKPGTMVRWTALVVAPRGEEPPHGCTHCPANLCKGRVLESLRAQHASRVDQSAGGGRGRLRVAYVGDGYSDLCAAEDAEVRFARASLITHLEREGFSYVPFENMHDVRLGLAEALGVESSPDR